MRRLIAGASLALAAAFLTGCGGDADDAPDDASSEDFCEAMESAPDGEGTPSEDDIQEWADELADTGTPDDIDDDQREGFEILVETLDDADPDDYADDAGLEDVIEDSDDREKVTAFFTYYGETCFDMPDVGEVPTE
jgi:hypothetical protein